MYMTPFQVKHINPARDNHLLTDMASYAMVVCRLHDAAESLAHGVFISRPSGKIQTHW